MRDALEAGLAGSSLLMATPTEIQVPLLAVVWALAALFAAVRLWRPARPRREAKGTALGAAAALGYCGFRCITVTLAYVGALSISMVVGIGAGLLLAWITLLPVLFVGGVCAALCFTMAGIALIGAVFGALMRTEAADAA